MKFRRVEFRCFGPFEEQALDLSGDGGLHIIFGENEAGKSSALRGMMAFLFEFPGQTKDDFRFKYNQFRVHALLENAAGRPLECIRRKGNKDTLRKPCDKEVIPERQLREFLGGLDQTQFEHLFGLDADRLRKGGDAIADGKGELGKALFEAGAGMKGLRVLSQRLTNRQEALYSVRGRKQIITESLREYTEMLKQADRLALAPETYQSAVTAADNARARVADLIRERVEIRNRLASLHRYQAALPTIDLLRTARERLAPVAGAPLLSKDFDAKLEKARDKFTTAASELVHLESDEKKLTDLLNQEQPSTKLLNEEDEVGELKKLIGADAKARKEEDRAKTFSIDELGMARDIYRELTGSTAWDQMDGLKPKLDERHRINNLANERSAALEDVSRQEQALREARAALAQALNKQKGIPSPVDPAPWQDAVDDVAAAGPLEDQYAKQTAAVEAEARRLASDFERFLPAPPGPWQNAPAQPVPLAETIERFRLDLETAHNLVAKIADDRSKTKNEQSALQRSLIDKVGAEPVPSVDELSGARHDRDDGLQCIRSRLGGRIEEPVENDFTARHAPGRPLIDAVEVSVRHCDMLADRLRHEADRVAGFQTIQHQLRSIAERLETLEIEAREAKDALAQLENEWHALWQPTGISPDSPKAMQTWLVNWAKLVERVVVWRENTQQCAEAKQRIDALLARLAKACPASRNAQTLVEALALTKRALAEAAAARAESVRLGEEVNRWQAAVEKAEDAEAKARSRRDDWALQWSQAVAILKLNDLSPSIETVQDYIKRIDQMQQHLREMRLKDARVREIKDDRLQLVERMNALRRRLDPDARPTTGEQESLNGDFRHVEIALQEAITQRTRHREYAKQLDDVQKKLAKTRKNMNEARTTLEALAAEVGVAVDAIPAAVQRARERAEVTAQVRQYEEALAQNALGTPMEAFVASALAHRDGLNQMIDDLARRVDQLDGDVSAAEAVLREQDSALAIFSQASDAAAEAQQKAVILAARLKDHVIEYAALHLALSALEKAKEQYRARNQDSLLSRAGAFFQRLTHDAFSGIDIDNEDGSDVLTAVRASSNRPDVRVPVSGLSDGTRDQLFLALRLAGIENHLRDREPVPLIVDDVLVNFDDPRTRATLECLAELAKKTQVIVFTHHQHLVDIARTLDPLPAFHNLTPCR